MTQNGWSEWNICPATIDDLKRRKEDFDKRFNYGKGQTHRQILKTSNFSLVDSTVYTCIFFKTQVFTGYFNI